MCDIGCIAETCRVDTAEGSCVSTISAAITVKQHRCCIPGLEVPHFVTLCILNAVEVTTIGSNTVIIAWPPCSVRQGVVLVPCDCCGCAGTCHVVNAQCALATSIGAAWIGDTGDTTIREVGHVAVHPELASGKWLLIWN